MWYEIEENPDVVIVDGLRFSRELFKHLADKENIGKLFRLVANNGDGTVTIEDVTALKSGAQPPQADNSESDAIALLDEADTILSVINPDCQWRKDYKKFIEQRTHIS